MMKQPDITEKNAQYYQCGNIGTFFIRSMGPYNKGETCQGHEHKIDHLTYLKKGKVRVDWLNPKTGENGSFLVLKPAKFLIKAEYHHKFTALANHTRWECWFSEAEADRVYGDAELVDWRG